MKRILSIVLAIALILTLISSCSYATDKPLTAAELLDLGEKYLLELNYEQALVYFERLIEIDPMNPRGYTGAAEAHMGMGREGDAIAVLEQGLEMTGDESFRAKITELTVSGNLVSSSDSQETGATNNNALRYPDDYITNTSEYRDMYYGRLEVLYELSLNNDIEYVKEYMRSNLGFWGPEWANERRSYSSALIETDFYSGQKLYWGETDANGRPSGFGVAMCEDGGITGSIFVYIGEWENGVRQGNGSYFGVSRVGKINSYDGQWANDLPNGWGISYSDYIPFEISEGEFIFTAGNVTNWMKHEGTFVDGYYHGDFVWTHHSKDYDDHDAVYTCSFDMGVGRPVEIGSLDFTWDRMTRDRTALVPLTREDIYRDGGWLITNNCIGCISNGRYNGRHHLWRQSEDFMYTAAMRFRTR